MRCKWLSILVLIGFSSCSAARLRSDNYHRILEKKESVSFIFFESEYQSNQLPASGWKLRLQVYQKGKSGFVSDLDQADRTQYLYHLRPGKYVVRRLEMVDEAGSVRIGVLPIGQIIDLKPGTIHYMGKFLLFRTNWTTNSQQYIIPPLSFFPDGMEKQQLSQKYAAGWGFEWQFDREDALKELYGDFPDIQDLDIESVILYPAQEIADQ